MEHKIANEIEKSYDLIINAIRIDDTTFEPQITEIARNVDQLQKQIQIETEEIEELNKTIRDQAVTD